MPDVLTEVETAPPAVAMVRHIVEKRPGAARGAVDYLDRALCGELWDALFVAETGHVCDACAGEFSRRHPGAPVPGAR